MLARSDSPNAHSSQARPVQRKGDTVSTASTTSATVVTTVLFSVPRQHLGKPGHGSSLIPGIGEHTADRLGERLAYQPGITRPAL
jgi:hypothetical protein